MSLVKEKGWKITLPGLTRSRASAQASTSQEERPDRFNEIAFHERLVKFIVSNDQVFPLRVCLTFNVLMPACLFGFQVDKCRGKL